MINIHSDIVNLFHMAGAAHKVDANIDEYKKTRSRKRKFKYRVTFNAPLLERKVATWNQHGAIFAQLFEHDPNMVIELSSFACEGVLDFNAKTGGLFEHHKWSDQDSKVNPFHSAYGTCVVHRWKIELTGVGRIMQCRRCDLAYFPELTDEMRRAGK